MQPLRRPSTIPPRPPSNPPRLSSRPVPADFTGGLGTGVHFRPARVSAAELPADLRCRFRCDGASVGPLAVLDLSTSGFAVEAPIDLALAPGSALDGLELLLRDRVIWSGRGTVVHGGPGRLGGRFDSGLVDLQQLRLAATLENRLEALREQRAGLPAEWRAAVSDLRQLLEDARLEVEKLESAGHEDPMRRSDEEAALFEGLRHRWGAVYYAAVASLHEQSKQLDARGRLLGRSYAQAALLPLLYACPITRRAYEKPLGYSGDYRQMELCATRELTGDGLFGRFLHSITQGYTIGRAVAGREIVMRQAVQQVVEEDTDEPARVLSVAAGPVIELRRLLEGGVKIRRPVELILLDQDEGAHETAHRQLTRLLVERHQRSLPVTITCLHLSVRQLLKPQSIEERRIVDGVLANLDLIYCAGLYDYLSDLLATRLTSILYGGLRPGGRLLLGNLVEAPDTTWVMDYVMDWSLTYRKDDGMLALASRLSPPPARAAVTHDSTDHCIFLDVTKSKGDGAAAGR